MSTGAAYAAVVLYYRRGPSFADTLEALLAQSVPPAQVVVVDNASDDGGVAAQLCDRFPSVELVSLTENVGYAGGMNRGAARLGDAADHVLFMTHEVQLAPDCAERLLEALLGDADGAIAGPELRLDTTGETWSAGGTLSSRGQPAHLDESSTATPTWIDGACMMFPRGWLDRLHGFDERFFLYWEDVDVCVRATDLGGRVSVVRGASAVQGTGLMPARWEARNRILFWRIHRRPSLVLVAVVHQGAKVVRDVLRAQLSIAAARITGSLSGLVAPRRPWTGAKP